MILTLMIDEFSQQYFTALRTKYFPKHCNYLDAHLTLFHHLQANETLIEQTIKEEQVRKKIPLKVSGIKHIGNGVAFGIESTELQKMHKEMQARFQPFLVHQDRQKLWPHITVQNKVTPYKSKQTALFLSESFKPFTITGVGIQSWLYLKGPWALKETFHFS